MLNSRFYWLVAFHYLEARQILLLEKDRQKQKGLWKCRGKNMRRNLQAIVKSADSIPEEEDFIYASPAFGRCNNYSLNYVNEKIRENNPLYSCQLS